jgi:hypothetical protein
MRIDLLEAFGLDLEIRNVLKSKYINELLPIQVRAVKEILMMNRWISPAEIKEVENSYEAFSCAIKRMGEDFSWLTETLAVLAKEIRWDLLAVAVIKDLSRRLTYDLTENGHAPSDVHIRRLGQAYISRLIAEGFDTPEVATDPPLTEMESLLSKHMAGWLYNHFHREYQKQRDAPQEAASGVCDTGGAKYGGKTAGQVKTGSEGMPAAPAASASSSLAPATTATTTTTTTITTKTTPMPGASDISFPRYLACILQNKDTLFALRTRLADTKYLRELIADPPVLLLDVRQMLVFYRGIQVILPLMSFRLLELLAKNTKMVVTRDEIYECLWPENEGNDGVSRPYEQQITDHKRKLLAGIRKGIKGVAGIDRAALENLIFTRHRMGYMLNLDRKEIVVL